MKLGNPLLSITVRATETIYAARFVNLDGTLAVADGAAVGVCQMDAVTDQLVPVDVIGTTVVESGGAFSAGDYLRIAGTSANCGRVVSAMTANTAYRVAKALEDSSAAGASTLVLLLNPVTVTATIV